MNFEQKVALGARPLNCLSPQIMLVDDPTSNHILYRCSPEDLRLAAVSPAFSHKLRGLDVTQGEGGKASITLTDFDVSSLSVSMVQCRC